MHDQQNSAFLGMNGPDIDYNDFSNGYTLFLFDEYGGLPQPDNVVSDIRKGNSKVIINFSSTLTENVTVIVYGMFNDMFEITKDRKIVH